MVRKLVLVDEFCSIFLMRNENLNLIEMNRFLEFNSRFVITKLRHFQVNFLVALLSIDFHALETDVRKEISLRTKTGSAAGDSILVPSLNLAPALEFERSDATRRLRLVLSELIVIMGQACIVFYHDFKNPAITRKDGLEQWFLTFFCSAHP